LPAWQVEDAISDKHRTLQLPQYFLAAVSEQVEAAIAEQQTLTRELHHKLTKQLARLEQREQRPIDLAADGLLDRAKILERSNTIQLERQRIERA
jgi:hypothetical protein